MILISHRGNINGRNPKYENQPSYIKKALNAGYDVEIDVWYTTKFWLGHDKPIYEINSKFLQNPKLWCHAKNIEALTMMEEFGNIHYFWHENDSYTLTSKNYVWTYPDKPLTTNSICMVNNKKNINNIKNCIGICSDYIEDFK